MEQKEEGKSKTTVNESACAGGVPQHATKVATDFPPVNKQELSSMTQDNDVSSPLQKSKLTLLTTCLAVESNDILAHPSLHYRQFFPYGPFLLQQLLELVYLWTWNRQSFVWRAI